MMRDTITRTLCTSTVHGCRLIMKDGSPVVEKLGPQKVFYDGAECDGQCLLEDIRSFLETECQTDF